MRAGTVSDPFAGFQDPSYTGFPCPTFGGAYSYYNLIWQVLLVPMGSRPFPEQKWIGGGNRKEWCEKSFCLCVACIG